MKNKLYLVGKWPVEINRHNVGLMLFGGVYTTEELAVQNCLDENHFFVTIETDTPNTVEDGMFDVVTVPKTNMVSRKRTDGGDAGSNGEKLEWVTWK